MGLWVAAFAGRRVALVVISGGFCSVSAKKEVVFWWLVQAALEFFRRIFGGGGMEVLVLFVSWSDRKRMKKMEDLSCRNFAGFRGGGAGKFINSETLL